MHPDSSDHYDGKRFHNPDRVEHGLLSALRWMATRSPREWPDWVEETPPDIPPARVGADELRVTFVNHATVLLQAADVNLLTDPVWAKRASPFRWIGPKRHRAAGIPFGELPPIDAVFVSHNHYDHMDSSALERLHREHGSRFVVPLGNGKLLRRWGIEAVELDWWESVPLTDEVRLTALPAQHWSNRLGVPRNAMLWAGCALEAPSGTAVFAADTGYGPHFREIRARLGAIRLALLPIGAYEPRWFMAPVHMDPADAVRAHRELDAAASVGIHYGTFQLTDEGIEEPIRKLERALEEAGIPAEEFRALKHGEGWSVPAEDGAPGTRPLPDAEVSSE